MKEEDGMMSTLGSLSPSPRRLSHGSLNLMTLSINIPPESQCFCTDGPLIKSIYEHLYDVILTYRLCDGIVQSPQQRRSFLIWCV